MSFLLIVAVVPAGMGANLALAIALFGSGALVAALGLIDDRHTLPARWRFAGHLTAAAWVLFWLGPLPPVPLFGHVVDLGWAATLLSGLYVVWSINLFNFMDGIDGIASLEAISVSLGGAFVWWLTQPQGDWLLAVSFAACVAGFLIWNFPPARIFMGDAGSGFLGCVIATLALWSSHTAPAPVLELVHPGRRLHGRCDRDPGAPRRPRRALQRSASQPRLPVRRATSSFAQAGVARLRWPSPLSGSFRSPWPWRCTWSTGSSASPSPMRRCWRWRAATRRVIAGGRRPAA